MKIASHVEGTRAAIYVDGIAEGMTQERLEEAVRKALSPVQDAAGAWISVKDALPKEDTRCLALFSDGSVEVRSGTSIAVFAYWASEFGVQIKYWMPLPELPEEEDDERLMS